MGDRGAPRMSMSMRLSVSMPRSSLQRSSGAMSVMTTAAYDQTKRYIVALFYCSIAWVFAASSLLLILVLCYNFGIVNAKRMRYVASSADHIGLQAAVIMSGALHVRDALHYAVQRELYREPQDFPTIRSTLEPVLLAATNVRGLHLTYSDRNYSILVQHFEQAGNLLFQSDMPDCHTRLGARGCMPATQAGSTAWFNEGAQLAADGDASFRWQGSPGLVLRGKGDLRTWSPTCSLLFRSVFPGTGVARSLIGRVTLDISSLRLGHHLGGSAALGSRGAAYVCDAGGNLLAAVEVGEQLVAQSHGARFRRVWELERAWAKLVQIDDFAAAGRAGLILREEQGFQIAISRLKGRGMESFFAVVVAERGPFMDELLAERCNLAQVILGLPYLVASLAVLACWQGERLKIGNEFDGSPADAALSRRSSWFPSISRSSSWYPTTDRSRTSWFTGFSRASLFSRFRRSRTSWATPKIRSLATQLELKATGVSS